MSNGAILVTGATGNVGAEVVRGLRSLHATVRVASRDGKGSPGENPGDEAVPLDFLQPDTWATALDGVHKVFLVRPPAISDVGTHINPFIDEARKRGVEHIVLLSLLGAEKIRVVPHRKIELYLERAGVPYTFLRPSFFMQNLSTTHLKEIRDGGIIAVPAGRGKTSFVDARDVAAVAVKALVESGHEQQAYPITGAAALDYGQVAEIFTNVLGRQVTYTSPSLVQFIRRMRKEGHPFGFTLVTSAIYTTARLGMAGQVTPDVQRLLGRPPITLRQFVIDNADVWAQPWESLPSG